MERRRMKEEDRGKEEEGGRGTGQEDEERYEMRGQKRN